MLLSLNLVKIPGTASCLEYTVHPVAEERPEAGGASTRGQAQTAPLHPQTQSQAVIVEGDAVSLLREEVKLGEDGREVGRCLGWQVRAAQSQRGYG